MDENTVRQLGFMLAEQARVLGMVAENEARKARGESPAYIGDDFYSSAVSLDAIARRV